jgi:hypothetical protein
VPRRNCDEILMVKSANKHNRLYATAKVMSERLI